MADSLLSAISEWSLTLALIISSIVTVLMLTLPPPYSNFDLVQIKENDFTEDDKRSADRSGYAYLQKHSNGDGKCQVNTTVQVVVLGDIGRSPRMQYHALSIASSGGQVQLIGYTDSDIHPGIQASRLINVVSIKPFSKRFQFDNKLLFLLVAPLKVAWQIWSLYYALGYRSSATKWMLVQNPPSIPTLAVAKVVCFFRNVRLVIDWHNFGYSILALRLGKEHPLVRLAEWYEGYFSRGATAHFAVSDAMTKVLQKKWNVKAKTLHDRPARVFQPLSSEQRLEFLHGLPETAEYASDILARKWRLVVSSTSWTSDEDFSILLEALVDYSNAVNENSLLPKILAIITGKGPQKEYYVSRIRQLKQDDKLPNAIVITAWLSTEDYASLLGSADLGISLHTSSSGVDLPMKVVDMFGAGLPVAGWNKFEAWPELVKEGSNGCGFDSAERLTEVLTELFGSHDVQLEKLRQGALEASKRRWDDEWMPIAGRILQLEP